MNSALFGAVFLHPLYLHPLSFPSPPCLSSVCQPADHDFPTARVPSSMFSSICLYTFPLRSFCSLPHHEFPSDILYLSPVSCAQAIFSRHHLVLPHSLASAQSSSVVFLLWGLMCQQGQESSFPHLLCGLILDLLLA